MARTSVRRQFGHQGERRIALDDHEEIVEIVRHAAGELADGVHFLRLAKLLLEQALLGDVVAEDCHAGDLAAAGDGVERLRQRAQPAPESCGSLRG